MFVRATEHAAIGLQRQLNNRIIVYCDRDTKRPAAIPEREMNIFRLVTSSGDRELGISAAKIRFIIPATGYA